MTKKITGILSKPIYFRYSFIIVMAINIPFYLLHIGTDNLYIFFILGTIFFGIGFFNMSSSNLLFVTTLIVAGRIFENQSRLDLSNFLIYEVTYLLIMFISVGLMKHAQKIRNDNLELILALSKALDSRDVKTSHHSRNTARYAVEIAKKMKMTDEMIEVVYRGGLLHDIGKIGVPENILTKPDRLTDYEYSTIKEHPVIGHEMIKHVADFTDNGILDIVLYHHERYDGKGYPKGLKGEEIPLVARIMSIADSFDAMTSTRVYRKQIDVESALKEIEINKGKQFDPEIADIFISIFDKAGDTRWGRIH